MKSHLIRFGSAVLCLLLLAGFSSADVVVADSTPATLLGDDFSDGSNDYWGVVDAGGTTINGLPFSNGVFGVTAPAGSLAGRDLDQAGGSGATTRMGQWTLSLPTGHTHFTNIDFTGIAAATQAGIADGPAAPVWVNAGLTFELQTNLGTVATQSYTPNSPNGDLALNGTGTILTVGGTALNFADLGGVGVTSVTFKLTATSDSSQEIFWTNGTLSGNAVLNPIPEPSGLLMLWGASVVGIIRRNKRSR